MKKIWIVFRSILVLLGFMVVVLAVCGLTLFREASPPLPSRMVLAYDFYGTPADAPDVPAWVLRFMPVEPSLAEVTNAIYKAAKDKRVEALAVRLLDGEYHWADVQELRAAVAAFRAAGKSTYVYAESYGDLYPGMAEYYLATAFEEIWVQPVGSVSITGFHAELPYFRKTLEMVGVVPDILQKGDYKTAPENALLDAMSEAQRSTIYGILASMMTDFFDGVVAGRKIPAEKIGSLIDGAPYTALEAKERNLVDTVGYMDELLAKILPDSGRDLVDAADYLYAEMPLVPASGHDAKADDVAVVYVSGMIVSGDSSGAGFMGEDMAYANDIADAILDAAEDEAVGAIVLRVDSPGGSPSASETIRRAVTVAKTKGKYVVVSMGSEAASGGYWVSVNADRIFANPGTITGSIGVFGGKASFAGFWEKVGINWDGVELGANANMWSMNSSYSDDQRAAVSRMLDDIYDGFIDRVAEGRSFGREVVEDMAQGRVWTGRQAKERGLVDEIGGLRVALEDVARKLGVASVEEMEVFTTPQHTDPIDEIRNIVSGGAAIMRGAAPVLQSLAILREPMRGITHSTGFAIQP
ncbi:MAG: signal peptide peptidase SppA [Proteobacteria bacterium]|nr:signal peptide peptidase SppA [Pseudomonadota bacterium]